jgi:hypothetical protein
MMNRKTRFRFAAVCIWTYSLFVASASAQPEVMAWSNLTGIRVDGQLLEFGTSLCVVQPGWSDITRTGKERQTTLYTRNAKTETTKLQLRPDREIRERDGVDWNLSAVQVVEETGPASARIDVEFSSPKETDIAGAFFCIELPASYYSSASVQLIQPASPAAAEVSLAPGVAEQNEYVRTVASGARFISPKRRLEVLFAEPTEIIIRDDRRRGNYDIQVYLTILSGKTAEGQTSKKSFNLTASGEIDRSPAQLTLDVSKPGQAFDGLGGNFRIQNAKLDPPVVQYNLDNLRVAWARVEMPWRFWDPDEDTDPLAAARAGKMNPRVHEAMEMARRLALKGMPVIVSSWSAPTWAILGDPRAAFGQEGPRGNPLNPDKMDRIRESLAGYLIHLKEKYGVEAAMFSFNESDLGINVRQTQREHAELIRTLGAHLASRGLATKMLLGDTSDATPLEFIKAAMQDPEAAKYVGAVSFHSWRGCTDQILAGWHAAARTLNVPLLVAEGSTDAAAWRYPQIFSEQSFALYEISLYTRILAIAQPKSILQWQLTADYSILTGGGVFGDAGEVRPTRRFWNLKQLASTPAGAFAMPVTSNRPEITCAAFGDIARSTYAVHLVNNGPTRPASLAGLPAGVKQLRVWVTDGQRGMQEAPPIPVSDGKAQFTLDATSFTTLISVE